MSLLPLIFFPASTDPVISSQPPTPSCEARPSSPRSVWSCFLLTFLRRVSLTHPHFALLSSLLLLHPLPFPLPSSQCLEVFMKDHLSVFLSSALFKTINYVCTNKIALDIKMDRPEPGRSVRKDDVDYARKESERSERRKKRVAADGKTLMGLVEAVWGDIYAARGLVPE